MSAPKPTKCVRCSGRKRPAPGTRWGAGCDLQAEESEGAGPAAGRHVPAQGPGGREAAGAARVPLDLAGSWERGLGFVPGVMGSQAGSSAER